MPDQLLDWDQFRAICGGNPSKKMLRRLIAEGVLPRPVPLGPASTEMVAIRGLEGAEAHSARQRRFQGSGTRADAA
jgi:hypothetical protein